MEHSETLPAKDRLTGKRLRFNPKPRLCRYCRDASIEHTPATRHNWDDATCPACRVYVTRLELRKRRQAFAAQTHKCLTQIPDLFKHARLRDFPDAFVSALLTQMSGPGLYLWGEPGRGKSHAMAGLLRHMVLVLRGECTVRRITFDRLSLAARDTYRPQSKVTELDALRPYLDADALLLEDVGVGRGLGQLETDFNVRLLQIILDDRIERKLPTFVTSNKALENLGFDDRVLSRLATFGIIKLGGKDRRNSEHVRQNTRYTSFD